MYEISQFSKILEIMFLTPYGFFDFQRIFDFFEDSEKLQCPLQNASCEVCWEGADDITVKHTMKKPVKCQVGYKLCSAPSFVEGEMPLIVDSCYTII